MVNRDQRYPIASATKSKETRNKILRKQVWHERFWQEIIYKSLISTFGKHTVMMTNKPKVGIKLL